MHQLWASGFRKGIELAVNSMEHAPLDTLTNDDIAQMVKAKIPIIPTLSVFAKVIDLPHWLDTPEGESYLQPVPLKQTREVLAIYREGITPEMAQQAYYDDIPWLTRQFPVMLENIARLYQAGATIGCGTDSGGWQLAMFGRIYEEIDLLVKIGLTPFEALRSATAINAHILRLDDKLGTLEEGKLADFCTIDGDPLQDTTALRRINSVVKGGKCIYQATLS
jgi:imidazolonepropionase-like amidohydrolase